MPRPGTPVIHPDWAAHHQPVAEGAMTSACRIRLPGVTAGAFNQATGSRTGVPHPPYYTGPCRVQPLTTGDHVVEVAEQQVTNRDYVVAVPVEVTTASPGDLVEITVAQDESLVGRTLTVQSVVRGSLVWQRNLLCTDDMG